MKAAAGARTFLESKSKTGFGSCNEIISQRLKSITRQPSDFLRTDYRLIMFKHRTGESFLAYCTRTHMWRPTYHDGEMGAGSQIETSSVDNISGSAKKAREELAIKNAKVNAGFILLLTFLNTFSFAPSSFACSSPCPAYTAARVTVQRTKCFLVKFLMRLSKHSDDTLITALAKSAFALTHCKAPELLLRRNLKRLSSSSFNLFL